MLIQTDFSNLQVLWIFLALLSGMASIICFITNKSTPAIILLFFSGVIIRVLAAGLDPFLYRWDEQYHALVAKNMMSHPFKPMLIANPVIDYDYRSWTSNHIWLHKQPWFLWQIALFFKIFGVNEFVLRLPSAIMLSLLTLVIYRIGKILSNSHIAWCGAFIYTFSCYFINFVTGITFTDHNDSAFIFYVSMSLWAWVEYDHSDKKMWVYLIGLFAGIAILNKWLAGLLVYSGWFTSVFVKKDKMERASGVRNIGIALIVTLIIVLPWQIYILTAFPRESMQEFLLNSEHFLNSLEGHTENRWYYFYLLSQQYGGLIVFFVILPGLFIFLKAMQHVTMKVAVVTWLVITYTFFTVAATKMPMFCAIVSPLIFLALGSILEVGIRKFREKLPARKYIFVLVVVLGFLAYDNLSINTIDELHSDNRMLWKEWRTNAIINKYVAEKIPSKDYVIFNAGGQNSIMLMFYSNNTVYGFYPDKQQYNSLKSAKTKIALFQDENVPDYLKSDPDIFKIHLQVQPHRTAGLQSILRN